MCTLETVARPPTCPVLRFEGDPLESMTRAAAPSGTERRCPGLGFHPGREIAPGGPAKAFVGWWELGGYVHVSKKKRRKREETTKEKRVALQRPPLGSTKRRLKKNVNTGRGYHRWGILPLGDIAADPAFGSICYRNLKLRKSNPAAERWESIYVGSKLCFGSTPRKSR